MYYTLVADSVFVLFRFIIVCLCILGELIGGRWRAYARVGRLMYEFE